MFKPAVRQSMQVQLKRLAGGNDGDGDEKPITFHQGGEHASLGVPQGQTIPPAKHAAAAAGKYGPKARKQELFRKNVLTGGR